MGLESAMNRMNNFIEALEQMGPHVNPGITAIPPQKNQTVNDHVSKLNKFTFNRCARGGIVGFIHTGITQQDLRRDGIHINKSGQKKLAEATMSFARSKHV